MPKYVVQEKKLTIRAIGTKRKLTELERAIRLWLESYKTKRGVHGLWVEEVNEEV
jgi:hypothetical protein